MIRPAVSRCQSAVSHVHLLTFLYTANVLVGSHVCSITDCVMYKGDNSKYYFDR